MRSRIKFFCMVWVPLFMITGCASIKPKPPVDQGSVEPGSVVHRGDKRFPLLGTPISVGNHLPSVGLLDAMTMKEVDLKTEPLVKILEFF